MTSSSLRGIFLPVATAVSLIVGTEQSIILGLVASACLAKMAVFNAIQQHRKEPQKPQSTGPSNDPETVEQALQRHADAGTLHPVVF